MGPLPGDGWCFNLQFVELTGISHFGVGSFNEDTNNLDVVAVDFDAVTQFGLSTCHCALGLRGRGRCD